MLSLFLSLLISTSPVQEIELRSLFSEVWGYVVGIPISPQCQQYLNSFEIFYFNYNEQSGCKAREDEIIFGCTDLDNTTISIRNFVRFEGKTFKKIEDNDINIGIASVLIYSHEVVHVIAVCELNDLNPYHDDPRLFNDDNSVEKVMYYFIRVLKIKKF